jgi:DNA polymerase I
VCRVAIRLPKRLKGPFTNSFYDRREGIIYLKKENGEVASTRTYPSFFLVKEDRDKFPDDEFGKDIVDWLDEGKHWRALIDPSVRRERINEMIHICQDENVNILEADVSPVRRWFSDTGALVSQKFRSLFFDFETHPLQIGFDDEAKKRHRIIAWAAYDMDGKNWCEVANKSSDANEEMLIKKFLNLAKDYDVLLAWNGDNYDFFVLKHRCKYHGMKIDWRQWNMLDYMQVVKKLLMSISDPDLKRSFALDAVGENVLGIKKLKLPVGGGKMHTLLPERASLLEAYVRRDVEIMLGVEQKREFLALHYALCAICRTFPHRGSTYPNELADGMLLRKAVQEDKHFPSRVFKEVNEDYKKYEGAYVLDPIIGFHTDIQVPDFASLYPSIIVSWNMSNETMLHDGVQYPHDVMANHAVATATGVRFRTDFEGMIPMSLRELIAKRNEYKKRSKDLPVESNEYRNVNRLSTAVKVVTNSFYGLLGNEGSRYHNREIARSVTLTGQLLIREMMKYFERKGFTSVAGDTDSVFVQTTVPEMQLMLHDINSNFIPSMLKNFGCRTNTVVMDFDKGFRTLLIVTKKRYAGRLALFKGREAPIDMKPEIKGLEIRRSDWARYTQELQYKYLMLILEVNVDPSDIDNALREDGQIFFSKELTREELVVNKGISKKPHLYTVKPPHVRIAQWMIDEGMEFFVGMKIPYIVMGHKPNVDAIHADKYTGTCDRHYYWEKQILPSILRLVNARFPNYMFSDFKEPRQGQFDFSNQAKRTTKKSKKTKTMKQVKIPIKTVKKIKKVKGVKSEIVTVTIPGKSGEGVVKGIGRLCRAFPGRYKLRIIVDLDDPSAEVDISTEQFVSMDCLKEINNAFPQTTIDPKPI